MIAELFILPLLLFALGTLIPLVTASQDRRVFRTVAHICTIIGSVALGILSLFLLLTATEFSWMAYHPFTAFSVRFTIDRLAAFFLLIIAVVSGCVALYAAEYVEHLGGGSRRNLLCGCTNLFILSMVLVVASADTISFIFFWELMAASSFFLVMYEYTGPETKKAGNPVSRCSRSSADNLYPGTITG